MCINPKEINNYNSLNRFARKNSVVILGSTYAKEMPVGELKQIFGIISDIYNRSLTDLSIFEADEVLNSIMKDLIPSKLILQLGETDLDNNHSVDEVIEKLISLIAMCKKADKKIKIVLVSLNNLKNKEIESEYNSRLEEIARKNSCVFADITSTNTADNEDPTHINAFRLLKYFMADDIALQII